MARCNLSSSTLFAAILLWSTTSSAQWRPLGSLSPQDSLAALDAVMEASLDLGVEASFRHTASGNTQFPRWRHARLLRDLRQRLVKSPDDDCVDGSLYFYNFDITYISHVEKNLFVTTALPLTGSIHADLYFKDSPGHYELSHFDSLVFNLAPSDRRRLANAFGCSRSYDLLYLIALYDSSIGVLDVQRQYSIEDVKVQKHLTSSGTTQYFLDFNQSSFGGATYSKRLVGYEIRNRKLHTAYDYEYVHSCPLDDGHRLSGYSMVGDTIRILGLEWQPNQAINQWKHGLPDSSTGTTFTMSFIYQDAQYKLQRASK